MSATQKSTIYTAAGAARTTEANVDPQFLDRWSPRSLSPEPLAEAEIRSLFEAARWAPSSSNIQPWLFVYAASDDELSRVRPILMDFNRRWADRAPLLAFVFTNRYNPKDGSLNRSAHFDAGAAWMALALQARKLGLYAHAMGGIHHDRAYEILDVPS